MSSAMRWRHGDVRPSRDALVCLAGSDLLVSCRLLSQMNGPRWLAGQQLAYHWSTPPDIACIYTAPRLGMLRVEYRKSPESIESGVRTANIADPGPTPQALNRRRAGVWSLTFASRDCLAGERRWWKNGLMTLITTTTGRFIFRPYKSLHVFLFYFVHAIFSLVGLTQF